MKKNRLGICVFYDSDGIVDDYVSYFLDKLAPFLSQLCIVVNGRLSNEGRKKLQRYSHNIILRENIGFDAYAYKCALESYGYEKLQEFNEVLVFNTTCFGPIYPFNELFEKIQNKTCDFWGVWDWKAPVNSDWVQGWHIPSFFCCYRNTLLKSETFKQYWETLPEIKTYNDAVLNHEQRQTPYFTQKGFKYEVCYDLAKYATDEEYWPHIREIEYIKNERFPLLKRRPFFIVNGQIDASHYKEIFSFIPKQTEYDLNLIIQNLKRTQNFDSITRTSVWKKMLWKIKSKIFLGKKSAKYKNKIKNSSDRDIIIKQLKDYENGK